MKLINSILYLEYCDLKEMGVSEGTIKSASFRNSNSLPIIKDPSDKRKILCDYQKISAKYKELVQNKFGNPHEYIAKQPIKDLMVTDFKAQAFYTAYRYGDNKSLSFQHIEQYTKAASFLNMIIKCNDDKSFVKKSSASPS